MEVQSVTGAPPAARSQPMGVSAELAEARSRLRAVTPAGNWDAVLAEVQKVREERSTSLLAALQVVYAKLAAGWIPTRRC